MGFNWDKVLEDIGNKIAGDLADTCDNASTEVKGILSEFDHMVAMMRQAGTYVVEKRCPKCQEIIRGPGHTCSDDVVDVSSDNQKEG